MKTGAVHSIFTQKEDEVNSTKEKDVTKEIAPIPLPVTSSSSGPLLAEMKKTRDNPELLQAYVKGRPKEANPTDEVFEKYPIESFGLAMLKGMGFKQDENEVHPYLLEGRPTLLGLGAKFAAPNETRNKNKRQYIAIGSLCQIEGTHRFAIVKQTDGVPGLDMILIRTPGMKSLNENENELIEIPISRKSLILIQDTSKFPSTHPCFRVLEMDERQNLIDAKKAEESYHKLQKLEETQSWIQEGLRVLIVDEKDEEIYKKKGIIVEVSDDGQRCNIQLEKDPSKIVKRIKEKYLQTIVPEVGKQVLIIKFGKYYKTIGKVMEKDKERERVKVLIGEEKEIEKFRFDDVCEIAIKKEGANM